MNDIQIWLPVIFWLCIGGVAIIASVVIAFKMIEKE